MSWIKRTFILNFIIFLFFTLLSVKVFDLALGFIGSSDHLENQTKHGQRSLSLKEHPPNNNIILIPSDVYMSGTQNLTKKEFVFRTDKDGFIVGPKNDKINDTVSIIFFGGSTTECLYVEEELRFPHLVSQNLNVRVLNGGVSGNHSMHSLLSMIGKGIPYKPSHIVLMHAINDLSLISKSLSYWNAPQSRSLVQTNSTTTNKFTAYGVVRLVKDLMIPNTWIRVRHKFSNTLERIAPQDEFTDYRDKKYEVSEVEKAMVIEFTASLKSFVALSKIWGIEPILMTQFNRFKINDEFSKASYEKTPQPIPYNDFIRLYKKANEIVRTVAKQEKVFLIDLEAEIPSTNEYIYDEVHLNTNGSKLVAEKITASFKTRYSSVY